MRSEQIARSLSRLPNWRLHNLSEQSAQLLNCSYGEKGHPYIQSEPLISTCADHCPSFRQRQQALWRVWFHLTDDIFVGTGGRGLMAAFSYPGWVVERRLYALPHTDWVVGNTLPPRHHPHWPLLWSDPQAITQLLPYKRSISLSCSLTQKATTAPSLFPHPVLSEELVSIYTSTSIKWAEPSHPSHTSVCCTMGAVLLHVGNMPTKGIGTPESVLPMVLTAIMLWEYSPTVACWSKQQMCGTKPIFTFDW